MDDVEGEVELRVGEVAEQVGVSASTIRLWEREFGMPVPIRTSGGHRRYRQADVDQLRALRELVSRGHPLGRPDGEGTNVSDEAGAVLATTRAVLRSRTAAEVRDAVAAFVRISGGELVPADQGGAAALPFDLSFGEGDPVLPTAQKPSVVRLRLERTLPAIYEDARRIVALLRSAADGRSGDG